MIPEHTTLFRKRFCWGCLCLLLFLCLTQIGHTQTPNAPPAPAGQGPVSSIVADFFKVIFGALALGLAGVIGAYLTRWRERIEKKRITHRAEAAEATARQAQEKVQEIERDKEKIIDRADAAEKTALQAQTKVQEIEKQSAAETEKTKRFAKEAEDELTKKTEEAQTPPPTEWTRFFKKEVKASARIAQELAGPSKVIVVASGKGGVGKSTVSLGLLEYYNRFGSTLLVDFDMPNRGLTSLLRSKDDNPELTNTLSELTRFADMPKFRAMFPNSQIVKGGKVAPSSTDQPSPAATDEFKGDLPDAEARLISDFKALAKEFREENGVCRLPRTKSFNGPEIVPIKNDAGVINRDNCLFMPSVRPGELFLSSRVFNAHFSEVFYFIRCLANWALNSNAVRTVILDCHGAHDLFMVGAIHAATDLVVVMTPDPGSFDGTYDLLAFADRLNQETTALKASIALLINNCRDWEVNSVEVIRRFFAEDGKSPIKPGVVIGIPSDEDVRLITSKYVLGKASSSTSWSAIRTVGEFQRRNEANAPHADDDLDALGPNAEEDEGA